MALCRRKAPRKESQKKDMHRNNLGNVHVKMLCLITAASLMAPPPAMAMEAEKGEIASGEQTWEEKEMEEQRKEGKEEGMDDAPMQEEVPFMPDPIIEAGPLINKEETRAGEIKEEGPAGEKEEAGAEKAEEAEEAPQPLPETDASYPVKGTCGEGVSYRYKSGTLTISYEGGEGIMDDYTYVTELPWYQYKDSIKAIVIEEGIVRIGDYAFTRCRYVKTVSIPSSVKEIGLKAFAYCDSLEEVTMPDIGAVLIDSGNSEFKSAYDYGKPLVPDRGTSETSWKIDGSTLYIRGRGAMDDYKFQEAPWYKKRDQIKKVVIESGVTHIGAYAFANFTSAKKFQIPDSVKSIGARAFYKNISLQSISLPDSLSDMGRMTFQDCTSLKEITLPQALTSVGEYSFCGCSSLKAVSIGAAATRIQRCAFYGTDGLQVDYGGTKALWQKVSVDAGNTPIKQAQMAYATEKMLKSSLSGPFESLVAAAIKEVQFIECEDELTLRPWSDPVKLGARATGGGALTYKSLDPSVAKVSKKGKITPLSEGVVTLQVKAEDTDAHTSAEKMVAVTVKGAAGTTIRTIEKKKKKVTVTYKPRHSYNGYQLEYSKTPDFKTAFVLMIDDPDQTSFTFSVPSSGTWYVRMKTVKKVGEKAFHSKWSEIKSI